VLSIFAVRLSGISVAQGFWSGVTIIVSFLWGAVVFHEHIGNLAFALIGLALLLVGIGRCGLSRLCVFALVTCTP
jgi:multidrug transporter EmrE-like cation transporter